MSAQIHAIFAEYTQLIEALSLDEAYLDVTDNLMGIALATEVAMQVRRKIFEATGLTASAGPRADHRKVCAYCTSKDIGGRTITLKVKHADFEQITRSRSVPIAARTASEIASGIEPALIALFPTPKSIRLLGVTLSALQTLANPEDTKEQLALAI